MVFAIVAALLVINVVWFGKVCADLEFTMTYALMRDVLLIILILALLHYGTLYYHIW